MAKSKRQSAPLQLSERLPIDQAVHRLAVRYGNPNNPHVARDRLNQAIRTSEVTLWGRKAGGDWFPLKIGFFERHLIISADAGPEGWHVYLEMQAGKVGVEDFDLYVVSDPLSRELLDQTGQPYEWAVSAKEIEDLDEDASSTKRGPKVQFDWDLIQTEFYVGLDNDDVGPDDPINVEHRADKLMTWCDEHFGQEKTPGSTAMREKISKWTTVWRRRPKSKK